jgi:hypothetical protein
VQIFENIKRQRHMIPTTTFEYSITSSYLTYIITTLLQNLEISSPIMTSTNAITKMHQTKLVTIKKRNKNLQRFVGFKVYDLEL